MSSLVDALWSDLFVITHHLHTISIIAPTRSVDEAE